MKGRSQEEQRLEIQSHLVLRVSLAEAEAQVRWPADLEDEPEPPAGVDDLTENWPAFRRAVQAGDEVWSYSTVWGNGVFGCGRRGFALVRQGRVLKWYETEMVC
jgi:hypothetical protein